MGELDGCQGVEYSSGRCELWTRPAGIGTTKPVAGFTCLRYDPVHVMKARSDGHYCPQGWSHQAGEASWGNGGDTDCWVRHPKPWGTVRTCEALGAGYTYLRGYDIDRGCGQSWFFTCERCVW